jgi:MFS family permease
MEQEIKKEKSKNIFYIGLLSFFGGIGLDIFSPILPIYLTSVLGFDKTFIGLVEGLATASTNIFKVVAGYFSDKFKKQKPIIFIGYFLSIIGRPLLAFFVSAPAVMGLRLADGTGRGVKDPAKDVLIAGSSAKESRGKSFGISRMLDTLGSVVGPLILVALLEIFKNSDKLYHYVLIFSAVPLLIALVILVWKVKETEESDKRQVTSEKKVENKLTTYDLRLTANKNQSLPKEFFIFLGIIILFTIGNSSDAFLILRAKNLGFTLIQIPIVIALFNFVYAMAAVPFGALSDKIGRIPTILIGWVSYALVYAGFGLATGTLIVWPLYILYGVYYATSEGVIKAFLTDIVGASHRGRAFGIYGTTIGLATLVASFIAGYLWDNFGANVPFYFGSTMALIAAIFLVLFSRKFTKA